MAVENGAIEDSETFERRSEDIVLTVARSGGSRSDTGMGEETMATVYCVRHGESTFNEWRKKSLRDFSWLWVRDPMILDAPLSAKGRAQAAELRQQVKDKHLDEAAQVIITSPLTRAIETMLGGFADSRAPIVVDVMCREMLDTACDVGRQPDELQASFPAIDFSALHPNWWVSTESNKPAPAVLVPTTPKEVLPLRESESQLDARIREFVRHLVARPEQHIVVVGHSSFFKRMLGMNRKLHNCELHEVQLSELAKQWE